MKKSFLNAAQLHELWRSEPESILIADTRHASAFVQGHIPGSENMGRERIEVLTSDEKRLVVIVSEDDQANGFEADVKASVLKGGYPAWKSAGLPVTPYSSDAMIKKEIQMNEPIFYQLFEPETSSFTYLLADPRTKEAILIDPVLETVERDLKLIEELGLKLIYVLDTHIHADHITGAGEIRKRTGARTAVSKGANIDCSDIALEDGQEIQFGEFTVRAMATPGHTDSCMSFVVGNKVFTGDALLIRSNGRTDFQQGSASKLYVSVTDRLYRLPEDTFVFPAHDYRGHTHSTIDMEKRFNARIPAHRELEEFVKIMKDLKLANPKKIHEAVPANMACGRKRDARSFTPQLIDGVQEISIETLFPLVSKAKLIDVRRPDEFNGELGHIAGARLVTLGPDLERFLSTQDRAEEFVFVCRTGNRSREACEISQKLGFKFTINLQGGMTRWNSLNLPVER